MNANRPHGHATGRDAQPLAATLGQLGDFRNGLNFTRDDEGAGMPVLKVKDFGDRTFAPDEGYDELNLVPARIPEDQLLHAGDIVIIRSNGNRDLVGRSLLVLRSPERPLTFSGFCIRFRPDSNRVDPRYIAYIIRSPEFRTRFSSYGSGTGIQNINQQILATSPVALPSLGIQRTIARILGALDDKIELNRRTNETLEAMARALFQSWFVDFDPVRAKMEGRQPEGMDAETAKLFPKGLEDSALGPIPIGWPIRPIGHLLSLVRGTTYSGQLVGQPGPALLGLGSIVEGGGFREGRYKTYGGECPAKLMLFPGELFVALKGATKDGSMVGSVARVPPSVPSGRLTQDTVKLDFVAPRAGLAHWLYRLLLTPDYRSYCANRVTGSAQAALSREDSRVFRPAAFRRSSRAVR